MMVVEEPNENKISYGYRVFSNLKLVRFPHSLAVTLHSFTFYVAHPIRSILISTFGACAISG